MSLPLRRLVGSASLVAVGAFVACGPPPAPIVVATPPNPSATPSATPVAKAPECKGLEVGKLAGPAPVAEGDDPPYVERVSVAEPSDPKLICELADLNLAAAEKAIIAEAATPRPAEKAKPWDGKAKPKYQDLVDKRFHLSPADWTLIHKNGFVVRPSAFEGTFSWAFHELYQSQVPLYVSADAIFHAIFASNDKLLEAIETQRLSPLMAQVLTGMHCALADAAAHWPVDIARDADVYLTVARSLLAAAPVKSLLGTDAEAAALVAQVQKHDGIQTVQLFGRARLVDFGAYVPRGHYSKELAPYFQAAMWLSRLELNLASRSCRSSQPGPAPDPTETPREAALAIGLSELAEAQPGAAQAIDVLDRAWGLLAGKREDVSFADLRALRAKAAIKGPNVTAAPALREAIGSGWKRTARLHPMPEGVAELPVIFTMLGPRVVPDTAAMHLLVNDVTPNRSLPHAGDIAYVLGHDRGKTYLAADLKAYPQLGPNLDKARKMLSGPLPEKDLYSAWLGAIRGLSAPNVGVVPSFMGTEAFADLRVGSTYAAYGQLRHNFVLMAGQEYGAAGCEIPDGFVDPVPAVYRALIEYAKRGDAVMAVLDPKDELGTRDYFARLSRTLATLEVIANDELAGRALTAAQKRFLSMVAEYKPPGTGGGATYTGWYFDLFRARKEEGLTDSRFVADFASSPQDETVAYAGAGAPRLGVFVVDIGGPPRLVVGPVATGFETVGPLAKRFSDTNWPTTPLAAPWEATYTSSSLKAPPLAITQDYDKKSFLSVKSSSALGPVTLTALNHNRKPMRSMTKTVGKKPVKFDILDDGVEGVHIQVGAFHHVATVGMSAMGPGPIDVYLGGMTAPPAE